MARLRGGEAWASALSVDGFAAIRSAGFEPVGQVFGAAVYPLSFTAGVSCPGTSAHEALTAGVVEFKVLGTAVRAEGCPPLARPFACDLSGQDFARLVMAGWVPAGIALGISVAARHEVLLTSDRSRWGRGTRRWRPTPI
jgi:hypothetical protein